jgi:NAD+ synthase (glutamine-hydrolysing)
LDSQNFIDNCEKSLNALKERIDYPAIIVGGIEKNHKTEGKPFFNSAFFIQNKTIKASFQKILIPTYDIFDEGRYFEPGFKINMYQFLDKKLGITICEDIWNIENLPNRRLYTRNPVSELAHEGIDILINISASPFAQNKLNLRHELLISASKTYGFPIFYANLIGGNDELIFDGASLVFDKNGHLINQAASFKEDFIITDLSKNNTKIELSNTDSIFSIHDALILGLRDYLAKTRFKSAVIGLSGGIDSAIVLYLAVKAIGKKNVLAVAMPSLYSSKSSLFDAKKLCQNLSVNLKTISIQPIFKSYLNTLKKEFRGKPQDITEENIQARIRGNILMALSNKFGHIVLSTGNKSELACGYCTLYGDMSGGLAVISDVFKTNIYKLANYINRKKEIIPKNIIQKAPSAELKPNQTDQDTLPPYNILDEILKYYIEDCIDYEEIINKGYDEKLVKKIISMVDKNEYKRRQAPPGLRVTHKAFGTGRRLPIARKMGNVIS